MRLGTAIERLFDNYVYASDKEWIRDKVAWALYQTWKEADDRKESGIPTSSEKSDNSQTCANCRFDHEEWFEEACDSCCGAHSNWQPKTEPQHDYEPAEPFEWSDYIKDIENEPQTEASAQTYERWLFKEPQTDCSWKRGE